MIIYGENVKFIPGIFPELPREKFKSISWELSGKYFLHFYQIPVRTHSNPRAKRSPTKEI